MRVLEINQNYIGNCTTEGYCRRGNRTRYVTWQLILKIDNSTNKILVPKYSLKRPITKQDQLSSFTKRE